MTQTFASQELPGIEHHDEADLFRGYRLALDRESECSAAKSEASRVVSAYEEMIQRHFEQTGRWVAGTSARASGVTVSVVDKPRATYDPARWAEIVRWAGANDLTHLVQRRLSDKAVEELVDAGRALPEGLSIEYHRQIAFRRS